ncbi:hypothetical protein ACFL0P_07580 [Candidatus Omnitrophota bacterium]
MCGCGCGEPKNTKYVCKACGREKIEEVKEGEEVKCCGQAMDKKE